MKKYVLQALTFIATPILNIYPVFLINIFTENQTGLGYLYSHLFLFLLWAANTCFLTYYYSKTIWEAYLLSYSKKIHALLHIGMFLACCIPYSKVPSILNDFHIWLSIFCISGYIYEWVYFLFQPIFTVNLLFRNKLIGLLCIFGISTFPFLSFGSVISLGELLYASLQPFYFYYWIHCIEKNKQRA